MNLDTSADELQSCLLDAHMSLDGKEKPICNTVKRQVFYKCAAVQQSRKSTTGLMTPSYIEFCLRPTSDLEHKQHLWLCFLFVKSGTELHQRSLYWEPWTYSYSSVSIFFFFWYFHLCLIWVTFIQLTTTARFWCHLQLGLFLFSHQMPDTKNACLQYCRLRQWWENWVVTRHPVVTVGQIKNNL